MIRWTKSVLLAVAVLYGAALLSTFSYAQERDLGFPDAGLELVAPVVDIPAVPAVTEPASPVAAAQQAAATVQQAMRTPKLLAVLGAIASILWVIVALMRRFGNYLMEPRRVKVFVLCAGAVAGLFATVAAGVSWSEAAMISLGGPGAIAINELLKLFRLAPKADVPTSPGGIPASPAEIVSARAHADALAVADSTPPPVVGEHKPEEPKPEEPKPEEPKPEEPKPEEPKA